MTIIKNNNPKVLIYDIETSLMLAYLFSLGKQRVNHSQLLASKSMWDIICINYCWNDGSAAKTIKWTPERGTAGVIEDFDKIIDEADLIIGKNSDRFDAKMINAQRMFAGLPGKPYWTLGNDDLEKQMRKYFRLPSQSLDYISGQLGYGGKIKMEFSDWVAISQWMDVQVLASDPSLAFDAYALDAVCNRFFKDDMGNILQRGEKAMNKMCKYGRKDVTDTRDVWNYCLQHFDPKFNMNAWLSPLDTPVCKHTDCGSSNIKKDGTRMQVSGRVQIYRCNDCGRQACKTSISSRTGKEGVAK